VSGSSVSAVTAVSSSGSTVSTGGTCVSAAAGVESPLQATLRAVVSVIKTYSVRMALLLSSRTARTLAEAAARSYARAASDVAAHLCNAQGCPKNTAMRRSYRM